MKETILITGVSGQDGSILARDLIKLGKNVVGTFRRGKSTSMWRLKEMKIFHDLNLVELDLSDQIETLRVLDKFSPSKIYHLAGDGFVADSFNHPKRTFDANLNTTITLLEAIRYRKSDIWTFLASSSEIFSGLKEEFVNELTNFKTLNPYGISKIACLELANIYIKLYGLSIATGIFFNHESPWRSNNYVAKKVSYNIARFKKGQNEPFFLGNLNVSRDWSSAEDFVKALIKLGNKKSIGDFIFASGKKTYLREFIVEMGKAADFELFFVGDGKDEKCIERKSGQIICKVSDKYFRTYDTPGKIGDATKLKNEINWEVTQSIEEIAKSMLYNDLQRLN